MTESPDPHIDRVTRADFEAVSEILRLSGLNVDLKAEFERDIALPWVRRDPSRGVPVAFLLAWSVADELHLLDMACHPAQRRRGHARALLDALLEFARTRHKRLVLLEVRCSNQAAIALYEGSGFQSSGVRRGYYSDTGEDALEMRIYFDPRTGEIVPEPS